MEQYTYTPGTCNIDERAKARWDTLGIAGLAMATTTWLLFIFIGFPFYGQLEILALLWIGFIGFWQSNLPFCEFASMNSRPRTRLQHFHLAMMPALLATGILGAGLLLSPMPASEMQKLYMRLLQSF
jgi:hypothetical protein